MKARERLKNRLELNKGQLKSANSSPDKIAVTNSMDEMANRALDENDKDISLFDPFSDGYDSAPECEGTASATDLALTAGSPGETEQATGSPQATHVHTTQEPTNPPLVRRTSSDEYWKDKVKKKSDEDEKTLSERRQVIRDEILSASNAGNVDRMIKQLHTLFVEDSKPSAELLHEIISNCRTKSNIYHFPFDEHENSQVFFSL